MNFSRRTLNESTEQAVTTDSGRQFHSSTTDNEKNSLRQRRDAKWLVEFQIKFIVAKWYILQEKRLNEWIGNTTHRNAIVNSSSVNGFKNNLHRFRSNQEVYFFFFFFFFKKCTIALNVILPEPETEVWVKLISNWIEVCYEQVDIEASKPASSIPIRYDIRTFSSLHRLSPQTPLLEV